MTGRPYDIDPVRTRELWFLAKAGDEKARHWFDRRFRAVLLRGVRADPLMGRLRKRYTAEDVVQEAFLSFYRSPESFTDRGRGSMERFLRTILRRTMISLVRGMGASKRSHGKDTQLLPVGEKNTGSAESPDVPAAQDPSPTSNARVQEYIELARQRLSDREWEVWELMEIDGWDSLEVAGRLDIPASTVRTIRLRARARVLEGLSRSQGIS